MLVRFVSFVLRWAWKVRQTRIGRRLPRVKWLADAVFLRWRKATFRVGIAGTLEIPLWDFYWVSVAACKRYEPEVEALLDRALTPSVAFIDGGANIGYRSAWAISRSTNIIAAEASPPTYARLKRTAALNNHRFQHLNAALWSHSGPTVEIVAHKQDHAAAGTSFQAQAEPTAPKAEIFTATPGIVVVVYSCSVYLSAGTQWNGHPADELTDSMCRPPLPPGLILRDGDGLPLFEIQAACST